MVWTMVSSPLLRSRDDHFPFSIIINGQGKVIMSRARPTTTGGGHSYFLQRWPVSLEQRNEASSTMPITIFTLLGWPGFSQLWTLLTFLPSLNQDKKVDWFMVELGIPLNPYLCVVNSPKTSFFLQSIQNHGGPTNSSKTSKRSNQTHQNGSFTKFAA